MTKTIVARWTNKNDPESPRRDVVKLDDGTYGIANGADMYFTTWTVSDLTSNPTCGCARASQGLLGPPDWVLGDTEKTAKKVEAGCVCTMAALWDGGCPSCKGGRCKSKA
jgi:hypothetical protein